MPAGPSTGDSTAAGGYVLTCTAALSVLRSRMSFLPAAVRGSSSFGGM